MHGNKAKLENSKIDLHRNKVKHEFWIFEMHRNKAKTEIFKVSFGRGAQVPPHLRSNEHA